MIRLNQRDRKRGFTLPELLVAMAVMGALAWTISMIYFSVLGIYNRNMWKLRPYDEATKAVERISDEAREAMIIQTDAASELRMVLPEKDANRDNVLVDTGTGLALSHGDIVVIYLSDRTGAYGAAGTCLWKGVQRKGTIELVPKAMIADDIHPELNPVDPATGLPRPLFKYWPDTNHLWGVEMWITSTALVRGQVHTQTAHGESYLRNL